MQGGPFGRVHGVAVADLDRQAAFHHPPSLRPDLVSPLGVEGCEEIREVAVAVVPPVKLDIVTDDQAMCVQQFDLMVGREGDVPRREPVPGHLFQGGLDQCVPDALGIFSGGREKPGTGCRRMRQAAQQFRKIGLPELSIGGSPGPVVDEIAMRVRADIERQNAECLAVAVAGNQVTRLPAAFRSGHSMALENVEEIPVEKGVSGGSEVLPVGARDFAGGGDGGNSQRRHRDARRREG